MRGNEASQKSENNEDDSQSALIYKLNKLQQNILFYFNNTLNIELTGKEIKLDLNNKNIGNIELNLLSGVDFKNIEEINLSHNNISDIEPLKNFKNLKKVDLSFNKINNINELKSISKYNNKIEKLYLNNNMIKDVKILKENIFPNIIEINIDNNNIIQKDIDDIKMMIINNKKRKKRKN
jgi:Leucine-rich repeat (LRR) protein